jgi:hypothetical protein
VAHFSRRNPSPPLQGGYQGFRAFVREDFRETCAYCLLKELFAGGQDNYEVDHFRPQSLFPDDAQNYYNLYWACHPCNKIKRITWPSFALLERGIGFVDLCADDFELHFEELGDGRWVGKTISARYTIDALRLNRSHLVEIRGLIRQLNGRPTYEPISPLPGRSVRTKPEF